MPHIQPLPDQITDAPATGCFGLGVETIDQRLKGGLPIGRLHETVGQNEGDGPSAAAFALLLALRGLEPGKPLLWIRHDKAERRSGRLDPHGFGALGADPARLILCRTETEKAALQAGLDAVRCAGIGALIIEIWGKPPMLDLTATRKLAFAAERSGVTAFLLRVAAQAEPSAAYSRWDVRAAPSTPLPANAPGFPAFAVTLLRDRRGLPGFSTILEWNCDTGCFRKPPLSGDLLPIPASRPAASGTPFHRAA